MYDDELGMCISGGETSSIVTPPGTLHSTHWYDEPPYESDPEDFLIGKEPPVR